MDKIIKQLNKILLSIILFFTTNIQCLQINYYDTIALKHYKTKRYLGIKFKTTPPNVIITSHPEFERHFSGWMLERFDRDNSFNLFYRTKNILFKSLSPRLRLFTSSAYLAIEDTKITFNNLLSQNINWDFIKNSGNRISDNVSTNDTIILQHINTKCYLAINNNNQLELKTKISDDCLWKIELLDY
jgi:hypothetical protein